jgi:Flp pilus assembly protein TadB
MAVDAGKQDRFWWLTVVIAVPVIGPAAYYFTEKKHEYARAPVHHVHQSETEEQHEKAPKKRKSHKKVDEEKVAKEEPKQEEVKEERKEEAKQEAVNDEVTLEELVKGENTPASS